MNLGYRLTSFKSRVWLSLQGFGQQKTDKQGAPIVQSELKEVARHYAIKYGALLLQAERMARDGVPNRQETFQREACIMVHRLHCALQQCPEEGPFSSEVIDASSEISAFSRCSNFLDRLCSVGGSPSVEAFVRCFTFKRFELGYWECDSLPIHDMWYL